MQQLRRFQKSRGVAQNVTNERFRTRLFLRVQQLFALFLVFGERFFHHKVVAERKTFQCVFYVAGVGRCNQQQIRALLREKFFFRRKTIFLGNVEIFAEPSNAVGTDIAKGHDFITVGGVMYQPTVRVRASAAQPDNRNGKNFLFHLFLLKIVNLIENFIKTLMKIAPKGTFDGFIISEKRHFVQPKTDRYMSKVEIYLLRGDFPYSFL